MQYENKLDRANAELDEMIARNTLIKAFQTIRNKKLLAERVEKLGCEVINPGV